METIVFFSHPNENFVEGKKKNLTIGNTKIVAEKISQALSIPMNELVPSTPYPRDYDSVVDVACQEKKNNEVISFVPFYPQLGKIDTLFLGFPNWWGTYPQIVATFLNETELNHTLIFPFCTHEGSGFGNSLTDLKQQCPTSEIKEGLSIRGSRVERSDKAIKNWLRAYQCEK